MGALESNTTNIYGIHLRESANDGSDFSNGATDYRVLFLGEDGSLKVKDSAGAVTQVGPGSGTTFPTAPTGARFFRTDHGMEFYYDGTRWLCTCEHVLHPVDDGGGVPFSASGAARAVHPGQSLGLDIWVKHYWALTNVLTTNDGSKYWTIQLSGATALSTVSNTPTTDVMESQSVAASRSLASNPVLYFVITKVSTPGNLYSAIGLSYRFIGT